MKNGLFWQLEAESRKTVERGAYLSAMFDNSGLEFLSTVAQTLFGKQKSLDTNCADWSAPLVSSDRPVQLLGKVVGRTI